MAKKFYNKDAPSEMLIKRALDVLVPNGVFEVRIPKAGVQGTVAGYFDDRSVAAATIAKLNDRHIYQGIYVTLNPVNPALLSRAHNRVEGRAQSLSSDADVLVRRWLPIDFDPRRPTGVSSTNAEHLAALTRAEEVKEWLAAAGWPDPVVANSGNGAHLLYPINEPNDLDTARLLSEVTRAIAAVWTDEHVIVDETVYNASRIWKIYGTVSAKGDDTEERPHRVAMLLATPPVPMAAVTRAQMDALAAPTRTEREDTIGARGRRIVDLGEYAESLGCKVVAGPLPLFGKGQKWLLEECPFNPDHKKPIVGVVEGRPIFRCLHNSCHSRGWRDFREKLDSSYASPETIVQRMLAGDPHDAQWTDGLARLSERNYRLVRDRLRAEGIKNLRELDKRVQTERQKQIEAEAADSGVPGNIYGLVIQIKQLQADGVMPVIWHNELDDSRRIGAWEDETHYKEEKHGARLHGEFHKRGLKWVSRQAIGQAIDYMLDMDGSRNPMQEYFDALAWDKIPRLDQWMVRSMGAEDTPYVHTVGRKWLISAVARALRPGCQADHMLILEGKQGIGKSRALRILGGPFYTDFGGTLNSVQDHQHLVHRTIGKNIVEMSELSSFKRSAVESLKHILTITEDHLRLAYRKDAATYKRTGVFAGTTNELDLKYINDPTGARRFWPVRCTGNIHADALTSQRDQIWAEAVAAFRAGEEWWITDENMLEEAANEQSKRQTQIQDDPWYSSVLDKLGDSETWKDGFITIHGGRPPTCRLMLDYYQIMTLWLTVPIKDQTTFNQQRLIAVLNKMGFRSRAVGDGASKRRRQVLARELAPADVIAVTRPHIERWTGQADDDRLSDRGATTH